jgi:hypothetical protein
LTKRNGPEPIVSVTLVKGSVIASFSRMMTGIVPLLAASAVSTKGKGSLSWRVNALSSTGFISLVNWASFWPMTSRTIQRLSEGMTSRVVTAVPSWNLRPGRSVKV